MAKLDEQACKALDLEGMSPEGRAAALRYVKRMELSNEKLDMVDLRAEGEDDDGYDPYSDYMDAQARSMHEDLSEDPWR